MNRNFISVIVNIDARSGHTLLNCMYGALSEERWVNQWAYLDALSNRYNCPWIILGYLNFILRQEEKLGGNLIAQSHLDDANDHVGKLDMSSVNFVGNPYTWSNKRSGTDLILERLDRAMANTEWFSYFPNVIVYHLVSIGSNHIPILLVTSRNDNPTRKPQRFNKCWLLDPSCMNVINESWNYDDVVGSFAYKHVKCLHHVKQKLRLWNIHTFGNIQTNINKIKGELDDLQQQQNSIATTTQITLLEDRLKHWYNAQHEYYPQRAKEDRLKFDDMNTKYFHDKVNYRKRRTQIESVQNNLGIWLTDRSMIAQELKDHFSKISKSTNPPVATDFLKILSPCIIDAENELLTCIPSDEEIRNTLWKMHPWTYPGPDGYPPGFYQTMWDLVGSDTCKMVKAFFHTGYLLKQMNHSFITLIPKTSSPKTATDFRPISLSNVSYKIISKILANRLKTVVDKFISPYQGAFLSSRQITNNVVIAHEIVHTMRNNRSKSGLMAIKLDMSKAFDRIEWPFLISILSQLGFNESWCGLIEQCVSTVFYSILLNGSPGEVFYPIRGLRKGYPMSPYLFIICMDVLSKVLVLAESKGDIQGIKITNDCPCHSISHLFFADDCLVFAKASVKCARNLYAMLQQFSKYSGQAINFDKSGLAFSPKTEPSIKNQIGDILHIKRLGLQDKYLGVPLLIQINKMENFSHLIDTFDNRLAPWIRKSVNQPGRTVLTQSVLGSLANHHLVVFPIPKKITDRLDSIQIRFWWNKRNGGIGLYLRSWDNVAKPIVLGG